MRAQLFILLCTISLLSGCTKHESEQSFLHVDGRYLVNEQGERFMVRGTNLGNWLNPEGYMFGFRTCNSVGKIHQAFTELIGPEQTDAFWEAFTTNYVTEADIRLIASTGANTIRLPFHYKLFTTDQYLGSNSPEEGFRFMDSVITWCGREGLYVILDMHDCPAGQTGDNIDDSTGWPWLFRSSKAQEQFIAIWTRIARRYKNEPVVLGYELMNEPIAHYFQDSLPALNAELEPLYIRTVNAIRQEDTKHIILLGGTQWNGTFRGVFREDWTGKNIAYACHRYGQSPDSTGIGDFISWRDSTGICTIMTETGHNTYDWIESMTRTMEQYEIGYTYWPYKKMGSSSWVGFKAPENWNLVQEYAESDRSSFAKVRQIRIADHTISQEAIMGFAEQSRLTNCTIDSLYLRAIFHKTDN